MDDPLQTAATPMFQTKLAFVSHALREAILDGRMAPGTRLVIDDLAKRLSVSAIPVREALQILQSERLVAIKPHIGAVVTGVEPDAIREIFALLEGIEMATFRLAAETATAADFLELTELVKAMEATADDLSWAALNVRFHAMVPRIARMPRAEEALARVTADWERLRRWTFREHPRPDATPANQEHRAMIEALRQGDIHALESLVRQHNRQALAHYINAFPKAP